MKTSTLAKCVPVFAWVAVGAFAAPAVCAADLRGAFVAGYDTGGDKIVTVTFTNGETDSLRANEGFYVGGGISVLNDSKDIEFQGTLSIKYSSISANNGDVSFTRYPLDLLAFYRTQNFRVGGGLTYVISPKVSGSGAAGNINATLDNAAGVVVQGDYLLGRVAIGLRYTGLDYKVAGTTVKSNGVGVTFGFTFGGN
jgi:hypothetical protein